MTGAVIKVQWDTSQLFVVLYQLHPVLNRRVEVTPQYGGHAFCRQRPVGYGVREFLVDNFSERGDFEWFYKDFVSL